MQRRKGGKFQTGAPGPGLSGAALELGWEWGWSRPGLRGPPSLELCCPLLASSGTAYMPGSVSGRCPTWPSTGPCLWMPRASVSSPHLYANHLWDPQPTASRGSRKNLHLLSPECLVD